MLPRSVDIMKKIDEKVSPFIAIALKFKCPVLSYDKHFKKQTEVKSLTIEKFIENLLKP